MERREWSAAFDAQGAEIESLRAELTGMAQAATAATVARDQEHEHTQARLAALTAAAQTAAARAQEITTRAADLKIALERADADVRARTAEMSQERERLSYLPAYSKRLVILTIHGLTTSRPRCLENYVLCSHDTSSRCQRTAFEPAADCALMVPSDALAATVK